MATESHGWIGTEIVNTRFGDFEFKNGYPTPEAADKLYEWLKFNRAVESYLHFVTIVSMFHMLYDKWSTDVAFVMYAAQPLVGKWLESFKEFPPRAKAASFSIDQIVESLMPKG